MNIFIEYVEYFTFSFSFSHSFGDVIVFTVVLMRCNLQHIAKHWKVNWKLKQNDIMYFWHSQITYTITTLYYSIAVASMLNVEYCAHHLVHSTPCTQYTVSICGVSSCLPAYFILWILILRFLSFELKSIKCFYFSRMN